MKKMKIFLSIVLLVLFSACGEEKSTSTLDPISPSEPALDRDSIFSKFNVGFGGVPSFPFSSKNGESTWISARNLILHDDVGEDPYYQNIKDYNSTAFTKLHKYVTKGKFFILWLTEGWEESWYEHEEIQALMDEGYIPVFNYWYFGDKLTYGLPNEQRKERYLEDNLRVANFLSTFSGKKMLIMEPEFNKKTVLKSEETQHEFAAILSKAISVIKGENPELLVSLSMMDVGRRDIRDSSATCAYKNCALGDVSTWEDPEIVFKDLLEQLDFISFHQMTAQFARDYDNPGSWDKPNIRVYSDEELGIELLAERISNFSKYLHQKYKKPVFMPYIAIATATWDDDNKNNKVEDSELDYYGWVNKAEDVYRRLAELKPTLKENGLFGFATMSLFDHPRHDYGEYQYFMQNEYHLGIIGTGAKDVNDTSPYGDLYFKGDILDSIFGAIE